MCMFYNCHVGDGTPSLAWYNAYWSVLPGNENCLEPKVIIADHVKSITPDAKIIFILRNPTQRYG